MSDFITGFVATWPIWLAIGGLTVLGFALCALSAGGHDYPARDEPAAPRLTPEQQRHQASFPVQRIGHADTLQQQRNKGEAR